MTLKRIMFLFLLLSVPLWLGFSNPVLAGDDLPKFVSIASNKVNMRTGPGQRYPIIWVYSRRGLPVEVINSFDTWRKIKDVQGDEGWVHQAMISHKRFGIIKEKPRQLFKDATVESAVVAELRPGVMPSIEQCSEHWCEVQVEGMNGWVEKAGLWGIYPDEIFED